MPRWFQSPVWRTDECPREGPWIKEGWRRGGRGTPGQRRWWAVPTACRPVLSPPGDCDDSTRNSVSELFQTLLGLSLVLSSSFYTCENQAGEGKGCTVVLSLGLPPGLLAVWDSKAGSVWPQSPRGARAGSLANHPDATRASSCVGKCVCGGGGWGGGAGRYAVGFTPLCTQGGLCRPWAGRSAPGGAHRRPQQAGKGRSGVWGPTATCSCASQDVSQSFQVPTAPREARSRDAHRTRPLGE